MLSYAVCSLLAVVCTAACQAPAQQAKIPPTNDRAPLPDLMLARGRVTVHAPSHVLRLGEQNVFDLELKGPALRKLLVGQSQPDAQGNFVVMSDDQGQELALEHRPDGGTFVNVVPYGLGTVQFTFFAVFADGGFERVDVTGQVAAQHPARKLSFDDGLARAPGRSNVYMAVGQQKKLWLYAEFEGVPQPIVVTAKDIRFKVRQTGGDKPPIQLDPKTGTIDSLRLGDALIESTYAGASLKFCVMVRETDSYSPGDCTELEDGGNGVLPVQQAADAPGAGWGSKLPYTASDGREGRFVAEDRLEIVNPEHSLFVAEENPVTLRVHGGSVARVECQSYAGCVPREGYYKPTPPFAFKAQPNGDIVANVFPDTLNNVEYNFTVLFADGGVAHKTLKANVTFGTKRPKAFNQSCGNDSYENPNLPIRLAVPANIKPTAPAKQLIAPGYHLWSSACYDGIPGGVVIPPALVSFRVLTEGEESPPITVDSVTGSVTSLHPGQALLEREFRGLKSATCFVLEARSETGFDVGDLSNCRALRAKYGAQLPPLPSPSNPHQYAGLPEVQEGINIKRATLSPDAKDRFEADDRLQIVTEGVSLPLGEPGTLPVRLTQLNVLKTAVFQQVLSSNGSRPPQPSEEIETDVKGGNGTIQIAPDGSASVKLVVRRLGRAKFRIEVLFADGGVATRTFEVAVRLPDHPPLRLTNAFGESFPIDATTLHLLPAPPRNVRWMFPVAWYQEGRRPIPLSPSDVKFDIRQAADPVIRLNEKTGEVTALRLGHALIETSFAGAKMETCVVVMADPITGDPSNCEELRGKKQ